MTGKDKMATIVFVSVIAGFTILMLALIVAVNFGGCN